MSTGYYVLMGRDDGGMVFKGSRETLEQAVGLAESLMLDDRDWDAYQVINKGTKQVVAERERSTHEHAN